MGDATAVFPNLGKSNYLSLTTFRRNGTPVSTPVWFAPEGDRIVLISRADAGKLKRIAHTPRVEVAPCDVRGRVKGASAEGIARILPPDETEVARRAIIRKYGLLGRLLLLRERLVSGAKTVYYEVRPLEA